IHSTIDFIPTALPYSVINDSTGNSQIGTKYTVGSYTITIYDTFSCQMPIWKLLVNASGVSIDYIDTTLDINDTLSPTYQEFVYSLPEPYTIIYLYSVSIIDRNIATCHTSGQYEVTVIDSNSCNIKIYNLVVYEDTVEIITSDTTVFYCHYGDSTSGSRYAFEYIPKYELPYFTYMIINDTIHYYNSDILTQGEYIIDYYDTSVNCRILR